MHRTTRLLSQRIGPLLRGETIFTSALDIVDSVVCSAKRQGPKGARKWRISRLTDVFDARYAPKAKR